MDASTCLGRRDATLSARRERRPTAMPILVICNVVLPVVIGGFIYLIWRTDTLLMFRWCGRLGVLPLVLDLRHHLSAARCHLPDWALYSLPDACWVYAATCAQRLIWQRRVAPLAASIWASVPPVLAIGGELGQLAKVVPGTFCSCDLVLCLLATVTCSPE